MARTWIKDNSGNGNVLRCFAKELPAAGGSVTLNGNINIVRVLGATGTVNITIDGSKSLPGDELTILVQATGATTLEIAGDAAPGSLQINAGGVGAVKLMNGGPEGSPLFVGIVPLS